MVTHTESQMILQDKVTRFLNLEAQLMDDNEYDDWLALWDKEGLYWVPMEHNPDEGLSLIYEDWTRLRDRIKILNSDKVYPQEPRSSLIRLVSNIHILGIEEDKLFVQSSFIVVERRKNQQTTFAGRSEYCLKHFQGEVEDFKIYSKTVHLLGANDPVGNITFLL